MSNNIVVAALYCFTPLPDHREWRERLYQLCQEYGIKGTLILASEGINGTIAGSREAIDAVRNCLQADPRMHGWEYKESYCDTPPFQKLKVKIKPEIVTLGVEGLSPAKQTGKHLSPDEWNELIQREDTILIDTRNSYEFVTGHFPRAIDPKTRHFREFPDFVRNHLAKHKDKKIAMYCTGGIRCEKASAYLLQQGFPEVYQLKGGILRYLEEVPPEKNLWQGYCFVFDERENLDGKLRPASPNPLLSHSVHAV